MKGIFNGEHQRKRGRGMVFVLVVVCLLMFAIDSYVGVEYPARAVAKGVLFVLVPGFFAMRHRGFWLRSVLSFSQEGRRELSRALFLGLLTYGGILTLAYLLRGQLDLPHIRTLLREDVGVHEGNFVFVALYIALINSFLEEFLFRGFGYLKLREYRGEAFSQGVSAGLFALYHIAIIDGWTSPYLTAAAIAGLFLTGVFFNLLNRRRKNIYASYLVHMFGNFAINTIGLHMLGIITLPFF